MAERKDRSGTSRMVDVVRLIFIALLATAGFEVAIQTGPPTTYRVLLGTFLGAAVGFVVGGVFGRLTATTITGIEKELHRRSAAEIAMGVAGVLVGLAIAFLVTMPMLLTLPPIASWPVTIFVYLVLGWLGYRVAFTRQEDLYGILGLKPRTFGAGRVEVNVIDTSVLIDGRIVDLASTGFVEGTFLIHSGVLAELQRIADSSDPHRRGRGRRGLDNLARLQRDPRVDVALVEEEGYGDVDAALVRLARDRGATLVTADVNLAKVAEAVSVPVRSINALAAALRQPVAPGDELVLKLVKEGREHGQAVGYLEDGTMVVVEEAAEMMGSEVRVTVTNMLQTPSGRMVFASIGN
jgi:uncharacterized protein YacL